MKGIFLQLFRHIFKLYCLYVKDYYSSYANSQKCTIFQKTQFEFDCTLCCRDNLQLVLRSLRTITIYNNQNDGLTSHHEEMIVILL